MNYLQGIIIDHGITNGRSSGDVKINVANAWHEILQHSPEWIDNCNRLVFIDLTKKCKIWYNI